jgi:cell division protein FtsB
VNFVNLVILVLKPFDPLVLWIEFWYLHAHMKSVVAFGLCLVLFNVAASERGLPALLRARQQANQLSRQISALRAENTRLKARASALRSDPATIEGAAREMLGLARADEIVVTRPK